MEMAFAFAAGDKAAGEVSASCMLCERIDQLLEFSVEAMTSTL